MTREDKAEILNQIQRSITAFKAMLDNAPSVSFRGFIGGRNKNCRFQDEIESVAKLLNDKQFTDIDRKYAAVQEALSKMPTTNAQQSMFVKNLLQTHRGDSDNRFNPAAPTKKS